MVLSANADARPETKKVFEALLDSLTFNTNLTDHGYCLGTNGDLRASPDQFTNIACVTDFDCLENNGALGAEFPLLLDIGVLILFSVIMITLASYSFERKG